MSTETGGLLTTDSLGKQDPPITGENAENVLSAQGDRIVAMSVLYDALATDCLPKLRLAEKRILKGWVGINAGFKQYTAIRETDPSRETPLTKQYRMARMPEVLYRTDDSGTVAKKLSGIQSLFFNLQDIAANFGAPLEAADEETAQQYALGYGIASATAREAFDEEEWEIKEAAATEGFREGTLEYAEAARLVWTAREEARAAAGLEEGGLRMARLSQASMGSQLPFHGYVFTDDGDNLSEDGINEGSNIDWAATAQNKHYIHEFYLRTDETVEKFQKNEGNVVNRWIALAKDEFYLANAYTRQYTSERPETLEGLLNPPSSWEDAVKLSFAATEGSMTASDIDDDEWVHGDVSEHAVLSALEDAWDSDHEQTTALEGMSVADRIALGATDDAIAGQFTAAREGWSGEQWIASAEGGASAPAKQGWLKAPHSIQFHGSFKQIWRHLEEATTTFSDEYGDVINFMAPAASDMIGGINELADAWQCITNAVKEYLQAELALRKAFKDAWEDESDWRAKTAGMIPLLGMDSIRNTGAMNDLIDAMLATPPTSLIGMNQQRNIFKEQCFLLSYIKQISQQKKQEDYEGGIRSGDTGQKALPYVSGSKNSTLLVDGRPYGFVNQLTQNPSARAFFNMDSAVLNNLQPLIRLYKVSHNRENETVQDEFVFESSAPNLASTLKTRAQRGAGVGVKSFDFTYEGSNPFAVKRSIRATLKIFANSMDELLLERIAQPSGRPISFSDLALKTRSSPEGGTPPSCEENVDSSRARAEANANLQRLDFRLKAVVGWSPPNGNGPWGKMSNLSTRYYGGEQEDVGRSELLDGIYDSYTTLNLTPTVHNFDFDEMGRVTLTINYLAYVEDFYDQPAFNIFAGSEVTSTLGTGSPTVHAMIRKLLIDFYSTRCEAEEVQNVKDNLKEDANNEKKQMMTSLVRRLKDDGRIMHINLPMEQIGFFNSEGPYYAWGAHPEGANAATAPSSLEISTSPEAATNAANAMEAAINNYSGFDGSSDSEEARLFRTGLTITNPASQDLAFVYVSDLVDSILTAIDDELTNLPRDLQTAISEKSSEIDACEADLQKAKVAQLHNAFKKMRILLGPVEFVNQAKIEETSLHCSFGDVPISLKYLLEWMAEQLSGNTSTIYTLTKFLNDLFNKLIRDFLNDGACFNWDIRPSGKVHINQATLTSYPLNPAQDEITRQFARRNRPRGNLKQFGYPILNLSGVEGTPIASKDVAEEMNYFVYCAGRTAPQELMKGIKLEDEARGIFHYMLGRNKGLIKNIKLIKTESRGLAEVRFEQDGYDGLKQLRVIYDAEIESYADVKTYPGTYIFLDPRGFAPTTNLICGDRLNLTDYGIGGYLMITKSEHSFAPGKASSKIFARWTASVEGCQQREGVTTEDEESQRGLSRCSSVISQRRDSADEDEFPGLSD
jgi:hypothetical protein